MRFSFIVTYIIIKTHRKSMLNWDINVCMCVYLCILKLKISTHERKTCSKLLKYLKEDSNL